MTEPDDRDPLVEQARRRRDRHARWLREGDMSVVRRLAQIGVLGWIIVTPMLAGAFLGRWLDGRLASGVSPAAGRETLTADQRYDERVLLGVRLAEGLPIADLREEGRGAVAGLIAEGLVEGSAALRRQRVVLTRQGRLLADTVVRRLLGLR